MIVFFIWFQKIWFQKIWFLKPALESLVVVFAITQSSIDEAHQFYGSLEAEFLIVSTEDVLMEDISYALLFQPQAGEEFIVALQWHLVLQVHASHYCVHALIVHFCKAESAFLQEEMARMFHVVQIVGIVYDSLYVALIVAHLHLCFKYIFAHIFYFFKILSEVG